MEEPDSLTGWYMRMLSRMNKQLLSSCNLIVANAYFSKEGFVTGTKILGLNIISHFQRIGQRLRMVCNGQGGHPQLVGPVKKVLDGRLSVQNGVLGVDMQMHKTHR